MGGEERIQRGERESRGVVGRREEADEGVVAEEVGLCGGGGRVEGGGGEEGGFGVEVGEGG